MIDFVIENNDSSFELLQVVWNTDDNETMVREERSLKAAEKELGFKGKIISSEDYIRNICQSSLLI